MTQNTDITRLTIAVEIATHAAATAMQFFEDRLTLDIRTKTPGQAVTDADLTVEGNIRTALHHAFPGEDIVGEEMGGAASTHFWTIDPIDGTANFVNGLPFWGIALGHSSDGQADLGVIALPALNTVVAGQGRKLWLNDEPFERSPPPIASVSLGHAKPDDMAETLDLHAQFRAADIAVCQWRCSAVSLAWAALGHISGHVHGSTTLWDTVPGEALCHAAGLDTRVGLRDTGALWVKTGDACLHGVTKSMWESPERKDR